MKHLLLDPIFKSPADEHFFVGYYDKSALDASSTRMLGMRVARIDRLPNANDEAVIGFFHLPSRQYVEVGVTNAFNWQQGAMLQWLGPSFSNDIIFNRRTERGFQAVIVDSSTGVERLLDSPIYAVSPQGDRALTVDFERHYWCRRGYSYDGIAKQEKNGRVVRGDGIWLVNINRNVSEKIVAIEDLLTISPLPSMIGATHYVEHITFSPDGQSFAFYHRWRLEEGGIYARMYVCALSQDAGPRLVHDTGRLSHYCWIDNKTILAGGAPKPSAASRLRKTKWLSRAVRPVIPLYRYLVKGNATDGQSVLSKIVTGDSYFLLDTSTCTTTTRFKGEIDRDGHPSAVPGKPGWIITDTYPDRNCVARLVLGNLDTQEMFVLNELRSIPAFDNSPCRCDLHPKVSRDGRFVCVDTMNDGVRSVYLFSLPEEVH